MDTGCIPPNCQLFSVHVSTKKQTDIYSRMNNLSGIVSIGGDGSACDLSISLLRGMPVFDSGCSEMDGSAVLRFIATGVWKNSFRPD